VVKKKVSEEEAKKVAAEITKKAVAWKLNDYDPEKPPKAFMTVCYKICEHVNCPHLEKCWSPKPVIPYVPTPPEAPTPAEATE